MKNLRVKSKNAKTERIQIKVTEKEKLELTKLCVKEELNISELIRSLIEEKINNRKSN